jgi:hypothetical protein
MDTEKELRQKARDRIKNMADLTVGVRAHPEQNAAIMVELGTLHVLLGELAEISSLRLEKHTRHLKYLTIALVIQTAVLIYFTLLLLKHPEHPS